MFQERFGNTLDGELGSLTETGQDYLHRQPRHCHVK